MKETEKNLPDEQVCIEDMHTYGYIWEGMLPLKKEKALELYNQDFLIFRLMPDGTEAMIDKQEELLNHDGLFGIEKKDWFAICEYNETKKFLRECADEKEKILLFGKESQFGIYQLKDGKEMKDYRFTSFSELQKMELEVKRENYELIYTSKYEDGMTLDWIYEKFNINHPKDFYGHSLSVSDIIVFQRDSVVCCYYVDSIGFKKVPDFISSTKTEITKKEKLNMTYYVIKDLSTWSANVGNKKSRLQRFDNLSAAIHVFNQYKSLEQESVEDCVRTTLGISYGLEEFDIIHVRNGENYLVTDFILLKYHTPALLSVLQIIHDMVGFEKIRTKRNMTPEEVKAWVKKRFECKLTNVADVSAYMKKFDECYKDGRFNDLLPTKRQQEVIEDIFVSDWDNPYFRTDLPNELAFSIGDKYVSIQTCSEGYDYSILDASYNLIDGGVYDNPDISIREALKEIIEDFQNSGVLNSFILTWVDYEYLESQQK